MTATQRPFRSVLYIPGSKERALEKATTLSTDAIIFDLEDAVAIDEKDNARSGLAEALRDKDYGIRSRLVRINGLDTTWGAADAKMAADVRPEAVLLPKVNSASDIDALAEITGAIPVWAMMETPLAVLNAAEICAHPLLQGIVMGTNDLAKDMRVQTGADRLPLMMGLQTCLMAARAHDVVAVDGVFNAFKDEEGLRAECAQGRALGFDGKTLIHPAQLAIANEIFSPSEAEIDLSRRQIEAFEAAEAAGEGVAVVDGSIVENLHVETARRILAQAEAIAELG